MTRPAGKKETMTTELVREDGSMHEAGWERIGDAGLARALGLMVRPEWLRERAVRLVAAAPELANALQGACGYIRERGMCPWPDCGKCMFFLHDDDCAADFAEAMMLCNALVVLRRCKAPIRDEMHLANGKEACGHA